MTDDTDAKGSRSATIGAGARGNVVQVGDSNTASVNYHESTAPPPESVDLMAELQAIREILAELQPPDAGKMERAMADAADEAQKPQPNPDEVGQALDRAVQYAKQAETFSGILDRLKPHVVAISTWLGTHWTQIGRAIGL